MSNWKNGQPYMPQSGETLEGLPAIAAFLDKSYSTVRSWIEFKGLPVLKEPSSGRWFTTKKAILAWIIATSERENARRFNPSLYVQSNKMNGTIPHNRREHAQAVRLQFDKDNALRSLLEK